MWLFSSRDTTNVHVKIPWTWVSFLERNQSRHKVSEIRSNPGNRQLNSLFRTRVEFRVAMHNAISTDQSRRSFYRAANAVFGRVGRIASEEVVLHLILTKCIPILLYGLEACPLRKTYLNSLDFVVNRFFMKLFQTGNIDLVKCCQSFFCFELPSAIHDRRASKFDLRYRNHSNLFCQMICVSE